jgi:uncharacterized membrane protein
MAHPPKYRPNEVAEFYQPGGFSFMPKTFGGFFGWLVGTLIVVAVGVAVLSRIPVVWNIVRKS